MSRLQLRNLPEVNIEQITRQLTQEFEHYDDAGQEYHQPLINIEQPGERTHLLVIWDVWQALSREERSRMVMEAYEAARGRDAALNVSVAMGLTQDEALRLGIAFVPVPL